MGDANTSEAEKPWLLAGAAWSVHGHQLPNVARSDDSRDTDTWLQGQHGG